MRGGGRGMYDSMCCDMSSIPLLKVYAEEGKCGSISISLWYLSFTVLWYHIIRDQKGLLADGGGEWGRVILILIIILLGSYILI